MGLLIWIPFVHGNCENQGSLNVETSVIGTVSYVNGKFGKAAKIGTGSQVSNGISINSNLLEELGDEYSCSVWVRPTGSHVHYEGAIISSGNWNGKRWAFGVNQSNTAVDLFGPNYNRNISCSIPVNEWTHLVSTFKNNIGTLYKNGELVGTYSFGNVTLESDATNTTIGRETYAAGYFGFNGDIEDIRVYNHCLSLEEIKHLSQGLTIHYPLSNRGFGGENLVDTTRTFPVPSNGTTTSIENGVKTNGVNADTYFNIPLQTTLLSGTTYTLSFYATQVPTDATLRFGLGAQTTSASSYCGAVTVKTGYNVHTFTPSINISTQIIMDDQSRTGLPVVEMTYFKIELGSKSTPWIPNSSDPLYSSLGLNSTAELDCSGYQYNATKNNVTVDTASPVNNGCYVFNGSSSWIRCDSNEWMVQGAEEMTINFWGYSDNWATKYTRMISCTESGGWNLEPGDSGYMRFPRHVYTNAAKTSTTYHLNSTAIKLSDLTAGWHMFTLVYTLTGEKIYIDGEPYSEAAQTSYGLHYNTNARLFLGCEANTASPASPYFNGKLSDFRLYYTALSANDIKELYRMGGNI